MGARGAQCGFDILYCFLIILSYRERDRCNVGSTLRCIARYRLRSMTIRHGDRTITDRMIAWAFNEYAVFANEHLAFTCIK